MHMVVIALACCAAPPPLIILEEDVFEIQKRTFILPIYLKPEREADVLRVRVYVSEDRSATWKLHKEWRSGDGGIPFTAPRDGLYWFANQVVMKGGNEPEDVKGLRAELKLYVNEAKRHLKNSEKSYVELKREVEELHETVEELRQKIKVLERAKGDRK